MCVCRAWRGEKGKACSGILLRKCCHLVWQHELSRDLGVPMPCLEERRHDSIDVVFVPVLSFFTWLLHYCNFSSSSQKMLESPGRPRCRSHWDHHWPLLQATEDNPSCDLVSNSRSLDPSSCIHPCICSGICVDPVRLDDIDDGLKRELIILLEAADKAAFVFT